MKPKPNYILLTSAILSLAAGILGMVGASKMPELQADLPGSDETAQKANSFWRMCIVEQCHAERGENGNNF